MQSTIWTYPWDAAEGDPDRVAGEIAETGLDAISLAATYHAFDQLRPRARNGRLLSSPRSSAYYPMSDSAFKGGLRPASSPFLNGARWQEVARCASNASLDVIAWTIFLHNSYLIQEYPELAQITCTGDALTHQLCPSQPRVRDYAVNLARDICRLEEVSVLECESISYGGFGHTHYHPKVGVDLGSGGRYLYSICFCASCCDGAQKAGIDVEALRNRITEKIENVFTIGSSIVATPAELCAADSELDAFQAFRDNQVTSLIEDVARSAGKPIRVLAMGDRMTSSLDVRAISAYVDAVEYLCYTNDRDRLRGMIQKSIEDVGSSRRLGVGLQAYPPASKTDDDLIHAVQLVRQAGAGVASFYNYGIMPPANIDWIRRALDT